MTFQAEIQAALGWSWDDGAVDTARLDFAARLAEGNGDGQAEAVWHADEQTLASGASTTLDLTALMRDVLGDTITIELLTVKALLIVSHAASAGELVIGGASSDEWSGPFGADGDQVVVPPDSPLLLVNSQAGWTIDSANRNLKLSAAGGEVVYSIAVVGTTTAAASGSGV